MSTLDFDIDSQMNVLEREWRDAFEEGIEASAQFSLLLGTKEAAADEIQSARELLERTELAKARIMAKIERLESKLNQ